MAPEPSLVDQIMDSLKRKAKEANIPIDDYIKQWLEVEWEDEDDDD